MSIPMTEMSHLGGDHHGASSSPSSNNSGPISYAQTDQMVRDPNELDTKRNFGNQFNALFRKSSTYQWRQYKTNACQISMPLLLVSSSSIIIDQVAHKHFHSYLSFLDYFIVDNYIGDMQGTKIPAILNPNATMPSIYDTNSTIAGDCLKYLPSVYAKDLYYINELKSNTTNEIAKLIPSYVNSQQMVVPLIFSEYILGDFAQYCSDTPSFVYPMGIVEGPATYDEFKTQIFDKWKTQTVNGAYNFGTVDNNKLEVTLMYNRSISYGKDLGLFYTLVTRSYRLITGNNITQFIFDGVKDFPTKKTTIGFDLISLIGPTLYIFIFQLILPVVLRIILYEKENKLREIMKMMGLEMKTYWLVTYIFSYSIYLFAMLLVWLLGAIFRFRYFTMNSPLAIFFLIFLWGHLLVSFAFFASVFFTKTDTGTVVGYIWVFGTGILASNVINNILANTSTPASSIFVISLFPPFSLFRGLKILATSVTFGENGLKAADIVSSGMADVYGFFIIESIIFLILALYLEEVLPSDYGVKRHPLFFLKPSYWRGDKVVVAPIDLNPTMEGEPADVAEERRRVMETKELLALEVLDLNKVYPAQGGAKRKVAVKALALGVDQGICFGFLGPNGAGKSTTISCVSGLFPPTNGTAKVFGMDIRNDIDRIHMVMGVCPQDNVLWDDLTGEEHLLFYGRIKNMKGKQLSNAVYEGLKQVNLHEETGKRSVAYSGGMRRRLSVACSLMGNPKIVLLDEPSTGLDPASRKQLWDIINAYKRKCAMLLTTHAMEEADALCDRLGLFVGGQLKCIGSSSELKSRFGKGYKVMMTVEHGYETEAQKFLFQQIPQANLLNALAGTFNYEVPRNSVELSTLFSEFEQNKERLHITDWGISNSTLEEVFIKITMGRQNERGEYIMDDKPVDLSHITNA
ncbi:hypothetical protein PPL_00079 [Heterostelium album PN500]|uniref:ABC transporter domain-containing protein n=1 Tax=Heterostelium pallidum (strain ATCC 26659 / Pp 5 / PN500) TaxID=670386 RepID=D3AVG9_HETP5|nr:hypothetical protein PPL_00079 [Heterostelium album PN500]EFA86292.1 hypothetical protein PPL_00079 [Heterostelium album PN500]|eukprot:XP_020438397.1 hypothetical protein PPL_00079 [Heterostelium album PN500]